MIASLFTMFTNRPAESDRSAADAPRLTSAQVFGRLLQGIRYARPDGAPMTRRAMVICSLRCLLHFEAFRDWFGNRDNPALLAELAHRPSLVACVRRPYLNSGWSAARKMEIIRRHYQLLSHQLPQLWFAPEASILIARVSDDLELRIDKAPWFEHEGELTFSLFQGAVRVYSIVFTLGRTESRCVAYLGAVQGLGREDALAIYRAMTHQMEGLRPRDLILTAFRRFCVGLGVSRILAVADDASVSRSAYFGSGLNRVFANYNQVWTENGGHEIEGGFFEIDVIASRRPLEETASRKRAQYRRRYELLDALGERIDGCLRALPSREAKFSGFGSTQTHELRSSQTAELRSSSRAAAQHAESS